MSLKQVKQATSLSALSAALRATARDLPKQLNTLSKTTLKSLSFRLIYTTPVDTTLAASNWQIGLVIPQIDVIPAYAVGEQGSTATQSRAAAFSAAKLIIDTKKYGTRAYVSNNTKHIVELNEGKSAQQPTPYWIYVTEAKVQALAHTRLRAILNGN